MTSNKCVWTGLSAFLNTLRIQGPTHMEYSESIQTNKSSSIIFLLFEHYHWPNSSSNLRVGLSMWHAFFWPSYFSLKLMDTSTISIHTPLCLPTLSFIPSGLKSLLTITIRKPTDHLSLSIILNTEIVLSPYGIIDQKDHSPVIPPTLSAKQLTDIAQRRPKQMRCWK